LRKPVGHSLTPVSSQHWRVWQILAPAQQAS
jgi:hypothetical protein